MLVGLRNKTLRAKLHISNLCSSQAFINLPHFGLHVLDASKVSPILTFQHVRPESESNPLLCSATVPGHHGQRGQGAARRPRWRCGSGRRSPPAGPAAAAVPPPAPGPPAATPPRRRSRPPPHRHRAGGWRGPASSRRGWGWRAGRAAGRRAAPSRRRWTARWGWRTPRV